MRNRWGPASCLTLLLGVVVGEIGDLHARQERDADGSPGGEGIVVVLGFPGHNWVGRHVQRGRVQMAMAAMRRFDCSKVLFTGGATRSRVGEARRWRNALAGRV